MTDYWKLPELPELSWYYLEDSYVLDISSDPGSLVFRMELVLTEQHPRYQPPAAGEQYCYARGSLAFRDVSGLDWVDKDFQTYTDATGEEDMGNIHALKKEDDHWRAVGDWGEVVVYSESGPSVTLD